MTLHLKPRGAGYLQSVRIDTKTAAEILGKSRGFLLCRVKAKRLRNFGRDGRYLFKLSDILAIAEEVEQKRELKDRKLQYDPAFSISVTLRADVSRSDLCKLQEEEGVDNIKDFLNQTIFLAGNDNLEDIKKSVTILGNKDLEKKE